jgi:hypothetical protein
VTLYANGVPQVAYQYTAAVTDGKLGVGTRNAISRFDNVTVQEFTAPAAAVLPHTETFDDSMADFFQVRAGTWTINSNRFAVTPTVGQDGVATLQVNDPLPPNLDLRAVINANPATTDFLSNAFIIFDYQSATDFKFAGAYVGSDQWIIGQRDASGWQIKASVNAVIDANTDYSLRVIIQNGTTASLYVNGALRTTYNFGSNVTDGEVGLGTRNAIARFDNFVVQPYTQPGPQIQVQGGFSRSFPVQPTSGRAPASVPMFAPTSVAPLAPPSSLVRALDRVMSQLGGQPHAAADWHLWWFALADFLAGTDDN